MTDDLGSATHPCIYDLAHCAPDSPFSPAELAERVRRYNKTPMSERTAALMVEEFWSRLEGTASVYIGTIQL